MLDLIQVIISFYMRHDAVRILGYHRGMHGKYKVMSWFSRASSVTGSSLPQYDLRLDKSGIREVRPSESTKPCLRRVLFIGVLCTTSINRRLWTFRNCFFSSCLRSCDRAYIVYEVIVDP